MSQAYYHHIPYNIDITYIYNIIICLTLFNYITTFIFSIDYHGEFGVLKDDSNLDMLLDSPTSSNISSNLMSNINTSYNNYNDIYNIDNNNNINQHNITLTNNNNNTSSNNYWYSILYILIIPTYDIKYMITSCCNNIKDSKNNMLAIRIFNLKLNLLKES
jgi:hypothetical protein